jgi:endonuclease/exonuclease/phosphatase family metal-dependent hydrolase
MHTSFGKTLDYQGGEYGIALLSRWRVTHDTLLHLLVVPAQRRAGGSYEPRGILYAVIARPGGDVHVLNTHLDASPSDSNRIQEIETVTTHAAAARRRGPTVVGGDLNATSESRVLAHIVTAGWADSFDACGTGDGGTFPARAPIKRIDYLLLDSTWRCVEARVLATEVSDHRPLFVRLISAGR